MRILVTGATGFVGRFLCLELSRQGYFVRAAARRVPAKPLEGVEETTIVGEIGPDTNWSEAIKEQDTVIHLAACTHKKKSKKGELESLYHRINVGGTGALARAAAKIGVKRFVYLSSVKAQGEISGLTPLKESSIPRPEDAYGRTKLEAEKTLLKVVDNSEMEAIILRPPLIYGPGVKGNFLSLINACAYRFPLPLGNVRNRRSLVFIGNLVDALIFLIEVKGFSREVFFVSDGESISTPELVRRISDSLGRPPRLVPCPIWMLRLGGALLGRLEMIDRLTSSLEIDDQKLKNTAGWTQPFSMLQGLEITADWFQNQNN